MASKTATAGSKRPRDPSNQGLKIKFLINIPLKVNSETEAQKRCCYLLTKLDEDFSKEDRNYRIEDVAVIIGMNGQYSRELDAVLKRLKTFRCESKTKFSIITYTWGSGGTIAQAATTPPYQDIREYLKNNAATTKLVEELRGKERCLVYFSFVDSDTFEFNSIYSEYITIVRDELRKDSIPPTVMSAGYEFTHEKEYHIASEQDRMIRSALAEVSPLLVYYPEPNFCVLVRDELNTIKESFIDPKRKKGEYSMESPVLIRQVKTRENFKAVFPWKKPIIIVTPERFNRWGQGLKTRQSTLVGRSLAIGAYCNRLLEHVETYNGAELPNDPQVRQNTHLKNLKFIMDLYKCDDDNEFEELSKKNPFSIDGKDATILVTAIREARECRKLVEERNESFSEDR
ncbi:uncharacterized protein [Garra rufa]|uniref:uncharacterized protein n=1 Tax=Garra rufa TaxID=137080 RepID=UPI003CCEC4BA